MTGACREVACHEETPEMAEQIDITPTKSRTSAVTRRTVGTREVESGIDGIRAEGSGAWMITGVPSAVRIVLDSQAMSFLDNHLPNPTNASPAVNMPRPLPKARS